MHYPWQQKQWQQLWQAKQAQRLPHAVLLCGVAGMGKAYFAEMFARALLCSHTSAAGESCQQCHACRLMTGRTHPNVIWVEPEKPGHAIKVDQVRAVSEFIQQSALKGDMRVVIINPANDMNAHAANALLKTLEEPTPGSLLLLVSHYQHRLPATIISRCQRITFTLPERDMAHQWLQSQFQDIRQDVNLLLTIAQGAPLKALDLADDKILADRTLLLDTISRTDANPVKLAEELQDLDSITIVNYLLTWIIDLIHLQLDNQIKTNHDYQATLQSLAKQLSLNQCIDFMNYLQRIYRQLAEGINRNKQLLIESILIRWQLQFNEVRHVSG